MQVGWFNRPQCARLEGSCSIRADSNPSSSGRQPGEEGAGDGAPHVSMRGREAGRLGTIVVLGRCTSRSGGGKEGASGLGENMHCPREI